MFHLHNPSAKADGYKTDLEASVSYLVSVTTTISFPLSPVSPPPRGQRPLARLLRCQSPAGGSKGVEIPEYLFVTKYVVPNGTFSLVLSNSSLISHFSFLFVPQSLRLCFQTGFKIFRYAPAFEPYILYRSSLITHSLPLSISHSLRPFFSSSLSLFVSLFTHR